MVRYKVMVDLSNRKNCGYVRAIGIYSIESMDSKIYLIERFPYDIHWWNNQPKNVRKVLKNRPVSLTHKEAKFLADRYFEEKVLLWPAPREMRVSSRIDNLEV